MLDDMIRNGYADCDIEYRITEVEKSASIDEEKVKQELYDALRDKKKVIEDLREQLAFRNSALEHEIAQKQVLEDDRRNLILRLEEALCTVPNVILSSEETQTIPEPRCAAAVQTTPSKRVMSRAAHSQTWDPPPNPSKHDHLAAHVKKLQDQLGEMRKQQSLIERSYENRLTELRLQHVRANEDMSKTHFSQEKLLGSTVLQLQEENIQLREQVALINNRNLISSDSDEFNGSGFCCAPGVRRKKKKKKKKPTKAGDEDLPNPYGLHTSEKQSAFWAASNGSGSNI